MRADSLNQFFKSILELVCAACLLPLPLVVVPFIYTTSTEPHSTYEHSQVDHVVGSPETHHICRSTTEDDAFAVGDSEQVSCAADEVSSSLEATITILTIGDCCRITNFENGAVGERCRNRGPFQIERQAR